MPPTTEVLIVGNYCHDTLLNSRGRFEVLGGSSSYVSAVLGSLGSRFEVIAKVGSNFRYAKQVPCVPLVDPQAPTTHFVDDFRSGTRQSLLTAECSPILPRDLGTRGARIGLACGVAREVRPETLVRLKELCPIVIADVQGLIRSRGAQGHDDQLVNLPLERTPFAQIIDRIDYLKIGEEELPFVDVQELSSRTTLLVTQGKQGSVLLRSGSECRVAALPVDEVDASGAGDCFTAGFAHALLHGLEPLEAMRLGNEFGALAVAQVGIPDFGLRV
jgi:1D-myo-inositol 3-kinase